MWHSKKSPSQGRSVHPTAFFSTSRPLPGPPFHLNFEYEISEGVDGRGFFEPGISPGGGGGSTATGGGGTPLFLTKLLPQRIDSDGAILVNGFVVSAYTPPPSPPPNSGGGYPPPGLGQIFFHKEPENHKKIHRFFPAIRRNNDNVQKLFIYEGDSVGL